MPTRIFISYADEDEDFCLELEKQLIPLMREGLAQIWHKRKILAGYDQHREIEKYQEKADITLLLISPDFFNSAYLYDTLLPQAIEQTGRGAQVIPILVRSTYWEFGLLKGAQALPGDKTPIALWTDRDQVYRLIVDDLRTLLLHLREDAGEKRVQASSVPDREFPGKNLNRLPSSIDKSYARHFAGREEREVQPVQIIIADNGSRISRVGQWQGKAPRDQKMVADNKSVMKDVQQGGELEREEGGVQRFFRWLLGER